MCALDYCKDRSVRARIKQIAACLVGLLLAACSLAPAVQNNSLDYNAVVEEVSNKSLVINILRARDKAPLYFPDLSIIRGSVAASASVQASLPYGPTFGTVQPGPFSASSNPSFDIAPTNTKKFYQGILNPVSKDFLAQRLLDNRIGSSAKPYFLLLVDGIDVINKDGIIVDTYEEGSSKYFKFLDSWDDSKTRVIKLAAGKTDMLGPEVDADPKAIVAASAAGLDVKSASPGKMQLVKKATETAICLRVDGLYTAVDVESDSSVKAPVGDAVGDDTKSKKAAKRDASPCSKLGAVSKIDARRLRLHLRSTERVFYFLGGLLRPGGYDRFTPETGAHAGCVLFPFFISDQPVENQRFSVEYRGSTYYVANIRQVPCRDGSLEYDQTVTVLALLNNLLNLNRDADEVPVTKAVQSVGGAI